MNNPNVNEYNASEYVENYQKKISIEKYKTIEGFFRIWVTKSFINKEIWWVSLLKNFLDEESSFDEKNYEIILNHIMISVIFNDSIFIRPDNLENLSNEEIKNILLSEPWTNNSNIKFWSDIWDYFWWILGDFDMNITKVKKDFTITDKQEKIVTKWLEKFLWKEFLKYTNKILEIKTKKNIWETIEQVVQKTIEILKQKK